jgi:hypothetical protein
VEYISQDSPGNAEDLLRTPPVSPRLRRTSALTETQPLPTAVLSDEARDTNHVVFSRQSGRHTVFTTPTSNLGSIPRLSAHQNPMSVLSSLTPMTIPYIPQHLLPPSPPTPTSLNRLSHDSLYAVQRASPLVCPNQLLIRELDDIRRSRELEGEARSALSYARAISVLKAYPRKITSRRETDGLPHIGTKLAGMVGTKRNCS